MKTLPGIYRPGNEVTRGISIVIYADPGIGKTTLATTLPVGETLIINTEAGWGPLLGTGHYVFDLKRDLKQLEELYQYLRTEKHPFTNIVLDNISELQDWLVHTLMTGRNKDFAEIREYGDASVKLKEYIRLFRDLTSERNFNVIFNAWEMPLEMEKTAMGIITKSFPKLFPKLTPEVCGIVDMVGHLEKYEKTGDRFIRFVGTSKILAKTQFKGVEEFEEANLPAVFAKVKAYNYATTVESTVNDELEKLKKGVKA